MKKNNILYCITAPSGSGKTSIMRSILFNEVVSFTTREMRSGEKDGLDYVFITKEEFDSMYANQQLVEWTEYGGNFYGLSLDELNKKMKIGHAFFICDNHGFNQIKEKYDNIVSIFLYADKEDCYQNMVDRGDDIEKINGRLSTYEDEIKNKGQYDYVVKNIRGNRDLTINIVRDIVKSEIFKHRRIDVKG